MKKIGFFGGKHMGYECLRHLVNEKIIPEFILVNPDDDGSDGPFYKSTRKLALDHDLNLVEGLENITSFEVDVIFSLGFLKIIEAHILNGPKIGIINAHPAPLPRYRGRYSTMQAIMNGERYHGITFHFLDKGIDTGDIILQKRFPIEENETGKSLYMKCSCAIKEEFKKLLNLILEDKTLPRVTQDEKIASYYKKEIPNDGFVDLSWEPDKIARYVRALYFPPFEPAKIRIGADVFHILPTQGS